VGIVRKKIGRRLGRESKKDAPEAREEERR